MRHSQFSSREMNIPKRSSSRQTRITKIPPIGRQKELERQKLKGYEHKIKNFDINHLCKLLKKYKDISDCGKIPIIEKVLEGKRKEKKKKKIFARLCAQQQKEKIKNDVKSINTVKSKKKYRKPSSNVCKIISRGKKRCI